MDKPINIPVLAKVPRHVAIIMDGNGRWAKKRHKTRLEGHRAGVDSIVKIVNVAKAVGIETVSLFAFSRENWLRPKHEVEGLMRLFLRGLKKEIKQLGKKDVALHVIGERSRLSKALREEIRRAEEESKDNKGLKLVVAVDYSGQWDIAQAAKKLAEQVKAGAVRSDQIDERVFGECVMLSDYPAPDLLIRTSGELRISNFFLWQIAYAELYFTETLWPDFDEEAFLKALLSYAHRERRFGMTE